MSKRNNLAIVKAVKDAIDHAPKLWRGKHTKRCPCYPCLEKRFDAYKDRVTRMADRPEMKDPEALIPVRAHFRRGRFLTQDEALRELVAKTVAEWTKRWGKR